MPKIVLITTPIRPVPTDFPPVGSLSVLTALRRAGFTDTHFYNIDLLRPSYEEALRHIVDARPDIFAISAVVSTAYEYTRKISLDVKKALPGCTILLGGNLGASAEIILKKTGVDFICTGEGERTAVEFARLWEANPASRERWAQVKGLAYLDAAGEMVTTPFPEAIPAQEVYDIDWGILSELDQLKYFILPAHQIAKLAAREANDPRIQKIKREGLKVAYLNTCKGCVARCTFCHRWDKGIRYIPVPTLMERLDVMVRDHGVGFVTMGDENFGTDRRWLKEFCAEMKTRGLLWRVGGMRVNCISPSIIEEMRDAGCTTILYGMESGSQRILDVMEKKTTAQQNRDAVKWMLEKGLATVIQLIVGMPGESPETVAETCDFMRYAATLSRDWNPNNVSVNFAQALPGTPLYEAGRRKGLIGRSLDDEERYLINISDRDARDGETTVNFTGCPRLELEKWQYDIENAGRWAYIEKFGIEAYREALRKSPLFEDDAAAAAQPTPEARAAKADTGYFASPARDLEMGATGASQEGFVPEAAETANSLHKRKDHTTFHPGEYPSAWQLVRMRKFFLLPTMHPTLFMRLRFLRTLIVAANVLRKYGLAVMPSVVWEYVSWKVARLSKPTSPVPYQSLRKSVNEGVLGEISGDKPAMEPLRAGR